MRRQLSSKEAAEMFWRAREELGGNTEAAAVLMYEVGFLGATRANARACALARTQRRRSESDRRNAAGIASARLLVDAIARLQKVDPRELRGRGKRRSIARIRLEAYWVMREIPGRRYSFPELADAFDRADHVTIIRGYRRVSREIKSDPGRRARLRNLARRVGAEA